MTRDEAIREACSIVGLVYYSIGDFSHASDGFCASCQANQGRGWHYANQGIALAYVRQAVLAALKRDGYRIHENFDPTTGKER